MFYLCQNSNFHEIFHYSIFETSPSTGRSRVDGFYPFWPIDWICYNLFSFKDGEDKFYNFKVLSSLDEQTFWILYFDFGMMSGSRRKVASSSAANKYSQAFIFSFASLFLGLWCSNSPYYDVLRLVRRVTLFWIPYIKFIFKKPETFSEIDTFELSRFSSGGSCELRCF